MTDFARRLEPDGTDRPVTPDTDSLFQPEVAVGPPQRSDCPGFGRGHFQARRQLL